MGFLYRSVTTLIEFLVRILKQEVVKKSASYFADRDKYTNYRLYLRKGYRCASKYPILSKITTVSPVN